MTLGLPTSVIGTSKSVGKPAHCYIEFILSSV
jgi:hypothetical protein